jgi:hypothetical protein
MSLKVIMKMLKVEGGQKKFVTSFFLVHCPLCPSLLQPGQLVQIGSGADFFPDIIGERREDASS